MSGHDADPGDLTPEDDPAEPASLGYAEAVAELDRILTRLDSPQLDIDELGDDVARAAELIAICRDRIDSARMRVAEIVADLDGDELEESGR
jgi:exodeoxyribonuclease VII small subunit